MSCCSSLRSLRMSKISSRARASSHLAKLRAPSHARDSASKARCARAAGVLLATCSERSGSTDAIAALAGYVAPDGGSRMGEQVARAGKARQFAFLCVVCQNRQISKFDRQSTHATTSRGFSSSVSSCTRARRASSNTVQPRHTHAHALNTDPRSRVAQSRTSVSLP